MNFGDKVLPNPVFNVHQTHTVIAVNRDAFGFKEVVKVYPPFMRAQTSDIWINAQCFEKA